MGTIRDAGELLRLAKELSTWLRGEKHDSLRLDCMNGLGVYTTTVLVESRFSKWAHKIGSKSREFSLDQVYDVRMEALKPFPGPIEGSVHRGDGKIVVDLTKVLDYDMFRMEVSYRMEQESLARLVHYRSSPEPLQEAWKYHLSAQLIDPSSLTRGFNAVDVLDFPVKARVYIQENINTAFPILKVFKRLGEIEAEMLSDYDPRHATKMIGLQRQRHLLKRKLGRGGPVEALRELLVLLRPTSFLRYLSADEEEDFRLHECTWGTEFFETLGAISLPKQMEVVARTDLNLDKPAAKGTLVYESGKFSTDVNGILGKAEPKRGQRSRKRGAPKHQD